MKALDQLAQEIAQARALGFAPARWDELAKTALAEVGDEWELEPAFRLRTGASDKWCRLHFETHAAEGLARLEEGKRCWHRHARMSRRRGMEPGALRREIVQSFHQKAS